MIGSLGVFSSSARSTKSPGRCPSPCAGAGGLPLPGAARAHAPRRGEGLPRRCEVAARVVAGEKPGARAGGKGLKKTVVIRKMNKDAKRRADDGSANKNRSVKKERENYQIAAFLSTLGVSSIAVLATYYRFEMHAASVGTGVASEELLASLMLTAGGAVGMEMWAQWAHRELWHDAWWNLHESHHRPREGAFEANDVFAVVNAPIAMALTAYGFLNEGVFAGACFGAGLGITLFGIGYMFVHDGLVHRRFPVGPVAEVPYMKRVAAAHTLHHAEKYGGVPWGLFLGPMELEQFGPEAKADLDRLVSSRDKFLSLKRQVKAAEASATSQAEISLLVKEAELAEQKLKKAADPR